MNKIKKGELYRHVDGFLKTKGVELKPGSYTDRIQRVCGLLSDVINTSHSGLERAKEVTEKRLDQVRQVIHEKTAPKSCATTTPSSTAPPAASEQTAPNASQPKTRRTKLKPTDKPTTKRAERQPVAKKIKRA